MTRLLQATTLFFLIVFTLIACSEKTYTNGSYSAKFDSFDDSGWKEYVKAEVEDGLIKRLEFDGVNKEGIKKSKDPDIRKDMEALTQTYPEKFYDDIKNQYIANGELEDVDTVAGATISTENFKILIAEIEKSIVEGNTDEIILSQQKRNEKKTKN